MPNTHSGKKRQRQAVVRRARNRAAKSVIKTYITRVREALAAGKIDVAEADFRITVKKLDQTAARGIIHSNQASRLKSRLSAAIKASKTKKSA
jgi:small subunit ribosomal protein S20